MKITVRDIAYRDGRSFVLGATRKPAPRKFAAECPFEYTPAGTPDADRHGENGRRTAWLKGANDALADYVTPSKRVSPARDRRAQARHAQHPITKLTKKGYTLGV